MPDADSPLMARPVVERWLAALEERHLSDLSFSEVTRALRALSAWYVQRRDRLTSGVVFDGAGKRAAFALFYGPLHFVTTASIVESLQAGRDVGRALLDLGCGTGVGSAAWALAAGSPTAITGIELHPWAAAEAAWTWRTLGLTGRAVRADVTRARWPGGPRTIVAAFTLNELPAHARSRVGDMLADAAAAGDAVLIVEPIAGAVAPWWPEWCARFGPLGGRADTWRFVMPLPSIVARLDRAAGLDHRELKARSLYVPAAPRRAHVG
jgi:hypothetical protein